MSSPLAGGPFLLCTFTDVVSNSKTTVQHILVILTFTTNCLLKVHVLENSQCKRNQAQ